MEVVLILVLFQLEIMVKMDTVKFVDMKIMIFRQSRE